MRIVLDASPLRDGRREAGIGRYIAALSEELGRIADLDIRLVVPPRSLPDSWVRRYLYAQPWLTGRALASRPDLVHAMATDPVLAWPASRQVVTVHDVAPWTTHLPPRGTPTFRYLAFQRRRFPRVAAVIAVSETSAREAESVLAVRPDRIHVVPEGVGTGFNPRPDARDASLRSASGAPLENYLFWVGNLRARDPRKGLDGLIDAVASLAELAPPLVLTGRTGDEAARISQVAAKRGVTVCFTGYVDDGKLAALYRGARAVVIPSVHEGFGLPMLEALASGAPIVATSGGNLAALAGNAAILVEPGDSRGLAEALRAVLSDDQLSKRLRAEGPQRAAPFTWRVAAERTAAVYRAAKRHS